MLYCRRRKIMRNLTRFLYVKILILDNKTCSLQPVIVACFVAKDSIEIVWLAVKTKFMTFLPRSSSSCWTIWWNYWKKKKRKRQFGSFWTARSTVFSPHFTRLHSEVEFFEWIISSCFNFTLFSLLCCCLDFCWAQPLVPVACSTAHSAMTLELRQEIP